MSHIRFLLPLAGLWLASPVFATDLAYVKCSANQDRVWVYESLSSFDVEAKLKCGEPVEILHRVKGYVRIRTESGVEGFVPDSVFPDLPALPDDADKPAAASAAQRSLASAAVAAAAKVTPAPAPAPVVVAAAKPAPVVVAPAPPVPAATQQVAITITPVGAPKPIAATAIVTAAQATPAKSSASAKSTIPATAPGHAAPSTKTQTASTRTKPATTVAKKVSPAPSTSTSSPAFDSAPAARIVHGAPAASASGLTPAKASVETVSARRDSAAVMSANAQPAAAAEESEDYPDTQVQNESADPSCRVYFAAYGLSPSQYKWMAESRHKEFSGICPAPDLAHVDYVVLFTHDSDTYTYAMPQPVHTDHNGFSDFSPMTTVDTALVKASDVEKARYEFVWVFRMTRGAFDPVKFSPRRRPQFTTYVKGARASQRSIEDAFNFVETQGVTR